MELRRAGPLDRNSLRRWRNDPEAREASFNTGEISADEHAAWYRRKLNDPDTLLLIAEVEGEPIGMVRFDRGGSEAEVSITLAPDSRGHGYGVEALELASAEAIRALGVEQVVALVKPDNERSRRVFERAGFSVDSTTEQAVRLSRSASSLQRDYR